MKIRKDLLPIKAHYLFGSAGIAPVLPYIPIIAKNLGFSSVAVGWVFTFGPISTIILKPLIGTYADKYSCRKLLFLLFTAIQIVLLFSLQWLPSLPSDNTVSINCRNETTLVACSDKLAEECYSARIIRSINNSLTCELEVPGQQNGSLSQGKKDLIGNVYVHLEGGKVENSCVFIRTNRTNLGDCGESESSHAQLYCDNEALREITKKPLLNDSQIFVSYQFWIFFCLIIGIKVLGSVGASLGDTLCFALLADKPEDYGTQRMWGAVGWGSVSLFAGYIVDKRSAGKADKDYSSSFYMCLIFLSINLIVSAMIKATKQQKSKNIVKDVKALFKSSKTNIYIAWCILGGVYNSVISHFIFWFIEDLAGRNGCADNSYIKSLEGLVLTVHCFCGEIPLFFLSGWIIRKIGHENVMRLVIFTFGVRFIMYWALTNPWWILPIESLNGITMGLFYSFMTTYASVISPPGTQATVQNLVTAIYEAVGTSLGGLIGGYLFDVIGTSQTFLTLGGSAFVFLLVLIMLHRIFIDDKTVFYSGVNAELKEKENETIEIKNELEKK